MGKEPRPILLKLHDTQTQRTVLSKAKNLKQADTEASRNVYIVPDKTPKYRELQNELNSTAFESCVWNIITLKKKDKLLVYCIAWEK